MNNNVILNGLSEGSLANASYGSNKLRDSSSVTQNDKLKKMNKKFKALMIDCDGTLVVHERDALPSKKVTEAINKASELMHVGLATSRGYAETINIAKHLNLTGPSILNGGSLIIDFKTGKTLWDKPIPEVTAKKIAKVFKRYDSSIFINDYLGDVKVTEREIPKKSYNLFSPAKTEETAKKILKELKKISEISSTYVPSWTKGKFDVLVYQSLATKQHGIFEVAKLLKLDPKDFIVIGDGYNDFPMLEAAGLAIAMGNASEDLKAIADYIAPSVYEDGVADVIQKFVL